MATNRNVKIISPRHDLNNCETTAIGVNCNKAPGVLLNVPIYGVTAVVNKGVSTVVDVDQVELVRYDCFPTK